MKQTITCLDHNFHKTQMAQISQLFWLRKIIAQIDHWIQINGKIFLENLIQSEITKIGTKIRDLNQKSDQTKASFKRKIPKNCAMKQKLCIIFDNPTSSTCFLTQHNSMATFFWKTSLNQKLPERRNCTASITCLSILLILLLLLLFLLPSGSLVPVSVSLFVLPSKICRLGLLSLH